MVTEFWVDKTTIPSGYTKAESCGDDDVFHVILRTQTLLHLREAQQWRPLCHVCVVTSFKLIWPVEAEPVSGINAVSEDADVTHAR